MNILLERLHFNFKTIIYLNGDHGNEEEISSNDDKGVNLNSKHIKELGQLTIVSKGLYTTASRLVRLVGLEPKDSTNLGLRQL